MTVRADSQIFPGQLNGGLQLSWRFAGEVHLVWVLWLMAAEHQFGEDTGIRWISGVCFLFSVLVCGSLGVFLSSYECVFSFMFGSVGCASVCFFLSFSYFLWSAICQTPTFSNSLQD